MFRGKKYKESAKLVDRSVQGIAAGTVDSRTAEKDTGA